MTGPTLMQTLLRQPSTSYSQRRPAHRQSLYETTDYSSRASSLRTSSINSGGSFYYGAGSGASTPARAGSSMSVRSDGAATTTTGGPASAQSGWVNGQWAWAAYGGRAGLTRGPSSLHPSEVASELGVRHKSSSARRSKSSRAVQSEAGSVNNDRDSDFDVMSFRSAKTSRSYSSIKSGTSARSARPHHELGNTAQWTHGPESLPVGAPPSRKKSPSSSSSSSSKRLPALVPGAPAPSRRYSSLSSTPSTSSSRLSHLRRNSSDSPASEAPSLTSSLSSARDSPPMTPVNVVHDPHFLESDPVEAQRKRKKKTVSAVPPADAGDVTKEEPPISRSSRRTKANLASVAEEDDERRKSRSDLGRLEDEVERTPVVTAVAAQPAVPAQADERLPRRYYSVDEFFAIAGHAGPSQAFPPPPSSKGESVDSDEGKTTVLNDRALSESGSDELAPSQTVPRISLTRTESDQSATGIKGDVDVMALDELDAGQSTTNRKRSTRRSKSDKIVGPAYAPVTIEVVKSSPTKVPRSTPVRNDSTSEEMNAAAAENGPQWLKRIRALGEPIEPLVKDVPASTKKGKTPVQPHWTVQQYEEREQQARLHRQLQEPSSAPRAVHRPSSLGNLRRPKWDALEPLPEQGEQESSIVSSDRSRHVRDDELAPVLALAPEPQQDPEAEPRASTSSESVLPLDSSRSASSSLETSPERSAPSTRSKSPVTIAPRDSRARPRSLSPSRGSPVRYDTQPFPSMAPPETLLQSPITTAFTVPPPAQPLPFHIPTAADEGFVRPRAMSTTSDTQSIRSTGGYSIMSMPTGAFHRPPKNPARASNRLSSMSTTSRTGNSNEPSVPTMGSLSVAATALARPAPSSSGFSLFRKIEPPLASSAAAARRFDASRDLAYTPLQPQPKRVKSDEVRVEVFAVGLDRLDVERVREMASRPDGFGWVPGRAFYGRVLDTGIEIKQLKRGDLVWGMTPMKKSATLSEIINVSKDRITLAPADTDLTVEEVAALPAMAMPALQAIEPLCQQLPKGSKILVLNAHEGVGNLCLQLAAYLRETRDLFVVAHCPITARDGAEFCRATGASHVIVDEPLAALNGLHESEFDAIVDTIGGRRLYDASRRVLHHSGTFITTIGDSLSVNSTSQWKSSIRSLRRTFIKKDKKLVRFLHVSSETVDQRGESVRDVLDRVRDAVVVGGVKPRVDRIWSLKDAAGAFKDSSIAGPGMLGEGKVVRIKEV